MVFDWVKKESPPQAGRRSLAQSRKGSEARAQARIGFRASLEAGQPSKPAKAWRTPSIY